MKESIYFTSIIIFSQISVRGDHEYQADIKAVFRNLEGHTE